VINSNECSDRMYPNKLFFFSSLCQSVCSLMFCFIFSIHFFGCLTWFLHPPVMEQCITFTGSHSLPILDTCPNHVSLCCAFCQPMSFPGLEYFVLSHSSSGCTSSPATIFLATSSLPLGFFICLFFQTPAFRAVQQYWNYECFIQLHFSHIWNVFKVT